jgi:hypothetical protein
MMCNVRRRRGILFDAQSPFAVAASSRLAGQGLASEQHDSNL